MTHVSACIALIVFGGCVPSEGMDTTPDVTLADDGTEVPETPPAEYPEVVITGIWEVEPDVVDIGLRNYGEVSYVYGEDFTVYCEFTGCYTAYQDQMRSYSDPPLEPDEVDVLRISIQFSDPDDQVATALCTVFCGALECDTDYYASDCDAGVTSGQVGR